MKKLSLLALLATTLMVSCNDDTPADAGTAARSATDSSASGTSVASTKKAWVPIDSTAAMRAMEVSATVGEQHRLLAKSDGKWTGKSLTWMAKGAPPSETEVKMENRMIMGGRYQESNYSGDMFGSPYMGRSIMGYDNYGKKYFATMIDNWSTAVMHMEGTYDAASKTYQLAGVFPNPANGQDCEMKQTYRLVDDNTEVMEMWGPDPATGESYKMMEITFKRAK